MSNGPLLDAHLRALKLPAVRNNYRRLAQSNTDPLAYLGDLISLEIGQRHENVVKARIAAAHFPAIKTFDAFDFTLQPRLPHLKLLEFADGRFIEERRNLILYGPPAPGRRIVSSPRG